MSLIDWVWPTELARERDKALIVDFLRSFGGSDVLAIRVDMEDYTRGKHDSAMRSDRSVHRLLRELEAEGAVKSKPDNIRGRLYSLVAPSEKLLEVE